MLATTGGGDARDDTAVGMRNARLASVRFCRIGKLLALTFCCEADLRLRSCEGFPDAALERGAGLEEGFACACAVGDEVLC